MKKLFLILGILGIFLNSLHSFETIVILPFKTKFYASPIKANRINRNLIDILDSKLNSKTINFYVMSDDRVLKILKELKLEDLRSFTYEEIKVISEYTKADYVITGSLERCKNHITNTVKIKCFSSKNEKIVFSKNFLQSTIEDICLEITDNLKIIFITNP